MYKSKLQELCHQYAWSLPEYVTVKDGPDHNPRFTTSITVNGVSFETPANQFRSSKEAQNQAAKLAIDHFIAPKPVLQHSINLTPLPNRPRPISSFPSAAKSGIVEPTKQENAQNLLAGETRLDFKDDKCCTDMLHMYKNRLQTYAQKRNLTLPTYSCEIMGPPHATRFKSKVAVDGKSYETSNFFTTLKEAEHAAAKVAFESLSLDEIQEDGGLYKSLLQQLTQKEGFLFPAYETDKSGPPHMPTFISTVEIGGESFQGHGAKTKKLAEMNAAKAAYTSLIERRATQYSTVSSPGFDIKGALEVSSFNLQPNVTDKVQPNVAEQVEPKVILETNSLIQEQTEVVKGRARQYSTVSSPDFHIEGALEVSSFNLQPNVTDEVQPNVVEQVEPKGIFETNCSIQEQAEEVQQTDFNAKKRRLSSESENVHAQLLDPFSSTFSPPKDGASLSSPLSEYSTNIVESAIKTSAGAHNSAFKKVLVCPRKPNMTYPDGATVLPISDNKWVAMRVDINPNQ